MAKIRGITMMANEAKRGNAHVMMPSISGLYIKKIASLFLQRAQHKRPSDLLPEFNCKVYVL